MQNASTHGTSIRNTSVAESLILQFCSTVHYTIKSIFHFISNYSQESRISNNTNYSNAKCTNAQNFNTLYLTLKDLHSFAHLCDSPLSPDFNAVVRTCLQTFPLAFEKLLNYKPSASNLPNTRRLWGRTKLIVRIYLSSLAMVRPSALSPFSLSAC